MPYEIKITYKIIIIGTVDTNKVERNTYFCMKYNYLGSEKWTQIQWKEILISVWSIIIWALKSGHKYSGKKYIFLYEIQLFGLWKVDTNIVERNKIYEI